MKKYIVSMALPMTVLLLAFAFVVPNSTQAQTVNCPAGYTCTPVAPQPVGCPAGFTCTPVAVNGSGSSITSDSGGTQICLSFSTPLGIGSYGPDVATLQSWLIFSGFDISNISRALTAKGYF